MHMDNTQHVSLLARQPGPRPLHGRAGSSRGRPRTEARAGRRPAAGARARAHDGQRRDDVQRVCQHLRPGRARMGPMHGSAWVTCMPGAYASLLASARHRRGYGPARAHVVGQTHALMRRRGCMRVCFAASPIRRRHPSAPQVQARARARPAPHPPGARRGPPRPQRAAARSRRRPRRRRSSSPPPDARRAAACAGPCSRAGAGLPAGARGCTGEQTGLPCPSTDKAGLPTPCCRALPAGPCKRRPHVLALEGLFGPQQPLGPDRPAGAHSPALQRPASSGGAHGPRWSRRAARHASRKSGPRSFLLPAAGALRLCSGRSGVCLWDARGKLQLSPLTSRLGGPTRQGAPRVRAEQQLALAARRVLLGVSLLAVCAAVPGVLAPASRAASARSGQGNKMVHKASGSMLGCAPGAPYRRRERSG